MTWRRAGLQSARVISFQKLAGLRPGISSVIITARNGVTSTAAVSLAKSPDTCAGPKLGIDGVTSATPSQHRIEGPHVLVDGWGSGYCSAQVGACPGNPSGLQDKESAVPGVTFPRFRTHRTRSSLRCGRSLIYESGPFGLARRWIPAQSTVWATRPCRTGHSWARAVGPRPPWPRQSPGPIPAVGPWSVKG